MDKLFLIQSFSSFLPFESTEEQFHAVCLLLRSPNSTVVVDDEKILSRCVLRTGVDGGRYVETISSCSLC